MPKMIIKHRRGTTDEWNKSTIIPAEGELVIEECSDGIQRFKIGNGYNLFKDLPYPDEKTLQAIDVANARIDNFISITEVDKTDPLYEVRDIRVGYDGITYDSAGEAVRAIGQDTSDLRNSLQQFINADAVDGLLYENNMLQLTASGVPVGEPVEVVGGSGGGGSGSSTVIRLINNNGSAAISAPVDSPVELKFTFTSIEDDVPTGDGTCTVTVNGLQRTTFGIPQGENKVNVAEYLIAGSNNVRITCTDQYGNSRSLVYTVTIIELRISSSFDCTAPFETDISFKYTPYGLIEKDIHFLIDGEEITVTKGFTASGKQTTQIIPMQSHGSHVLDVYMTTSLNGADVESNHLLYEIMCVESGKNYAMMSSVFTTTKATQGDLISIPYIIYDPNSLTATVELTVSYMSNGTEIKYSSTEIVVDRTQQYWSTRQYPEGNVKFTISCNYLYPPAEIKTLVRSYSVQVEEADIDVEAETNDLELFLSAAGRSNYEANPATWTYNDVTTSFSNFNWKSNGWITDASGDVCLRVNGDAQATINFQPFENDFRPEGKTIEFEFAVHDVNKRDEVVISCYNGSIGFQATADTAFLKSQDTFIQCNYKEEEKVRVAFAVEKQSDGNRFMYIYLDGVMSGVTQYGASDNFEQSDPALSITLGSPYCGLDLYAIRVYTTALTSDQLIDNYIADTGDPVKKMKIFTDNDIFDDYTKELSYSKLKQKIPTVTFIGKMPTAKGDKKNYSVRMIFEHPDHPELNFDEILKQIDVQGTSSAGYVRKNWKTKHDSKKLHMIGELPAKVFCLKVDYAEGTGTHNTQNANLVETLYTEPIPPMKEADFPSSMTKDEKDEISKVRTTITGYPIVIFHLDIDDMDIITNITKEELALRTDLKFSSKGNFNFDKDAEDVFAFNDNYDTECWEFLQNSDQNSFLTPWPEDHTKYWEARYHSRLGDLEDLQEAGNTAAATRLQDEMIERFKVMYEWVHSTARGSYVDADGVEHQLTTNQPLSSPYTDKFGEIYEIDNDEYRLAKFKTEFENYFNLHYTTIYYLYTFFALMVDQRAKNLFLTYWHDNAYDNNTPGKWYPYFYDNDTSYGINNTGHLTFDYYHEDIDTIGTAKVFNGQDSVLWCNFRDAFANEIRTMYAYLRNNNKLTYNSIVDRFIENGSSKWSASVYNQDAEYKYISIATPESDWDADGDGTPDQTGAYLYEVRGNGEHHLKYFVQNRIKYCDSKWKCANYLTDIVTVRIYTPSSKEITSDMSAEERAEVEALNTTLQVVPPSANITITPYSNMYCGVAYGAASGDDPTIYMKQVRATKNVPVTFEAGSSNVNDKETYVYGASEISSFGDLSPLYCKLLDVGAATKLTELKVGNQKAGYLNTNLETVTVGSNTLLKMIDVSNCPNLKNTLDVSKCTNIEEIYAEGSGISSVTLPAAGYVRKLKLPSTITSLTIKDQLYIEELTLQNYNGIQTLFIDNCPTVDTVAFLERCKDADGNYTVERVRLTNINWPNASMEFIRSLYKLKGRDENDVNTNDAYLIGTAHISKLTGAEMAEIKSHYPYLEITYDELTATLTFMDSTGTVELDKQTITSYDSKASNGICSVTSGKIDTPVKESTAQYHFNWAGWTTQKDAPTVVEPSSLLAVTADRIVYPAFTPELRSYIVRFYNDDILLSQILAWYGTEAIYGLDNSGDTDGDHVTDSKEPVKQNTSQPELFEFTGWHPKPEYITGPMDCYAQFYIDIGDYYQVGNNDISYKLKDNTLEITDYLSAQNVISVPEKFNIGGADYTTIIIGGFNDTNIELIHLPDTVTKFEEQAFNNCSELTDITIGENVKQINDMSFANLTSLKTVQYNAIEAEVIRNTVTESPFENSVSNDGVILTVGNKVKVIPKYLFNQYHTLTNKRAVNRIEWEETSSCEKIDDYAFRDANLAEISFPESLKTIGSYAFDRNTDIERLVLPPHLETINTRAFQDWDKLKYIYLPKSVSVIGSSVFANSGMLETIEIESGNSTFVAINGCLIHRADKRLLRGTNSAIIPQDGSVLSFDPLAFSGLVDIQSLAVPEGVTELSANFCSSCPLLSRVVLPRTLTFISSQAFYHCHSLGIEDEGKLVIPDSVTNINSYSFADCTSLKMITLPKDLRYIGGGAFNGCTALETLIFRTSSIPVDQYGEKSLSGCVNLKDIYWPGSETEAARSIWNWMGVDTNNVTIHYNYEVQD